MNPEEIERLLTGEFPDSDVTASGQDGKYQVRIISEAFAGQNAVKRQQSVYRVLNPHITSGAIHAISMQLLTSGEHAGDGK